MNNNKTKFHKIKESANTLSVYQKKTITICRKYRTIGTPSSLKHIAQNFQHTALKVLYMKVMGNILIIILSQQNRLQYDTQMLETASLDLKQLKHIFSIPGKYNW